MVNYTLFTNIIMYNLICHFELKLPNAFSAFHPAANTCQFKCLYRLLVAWQYGTQELVSGMIITDPEHWGFRLKRRDYHGIIAQRSPYKSHNAKRAWFVLVFDVIMQWVYSRPNTTVNGDPYDVELLLPNHILTGTSALLPGVIQ